MVLRGVCVGFGVAIWETMLMELVPDAPALARGQPRLLRLVRADAGRARARRRRLGARRAGTLIAAGAGVNAVLLAIVLTRPWLRAVD